MMATPVEESRRPPLQLDPLGGRPVRLRSMRSAGLLLLAVSMASGCAETQVPFTKNLRDQYRLQADEIKRIQFYISDAVSLDTKPTGEIQRNVTEQHGLEAQHITHEERLSIPKGTPGIVVGLTGDDLEVDFGGGFLCDFAPVAFSANDIPYMLVRINGQRLNRSGSTWVQINHIWYMYSSGAPYGPYLKAEVNERSIANTRAKSVEGRKL